MTKTIVCGVESTDAAVGAARVAERLSVALDLPLIFVHVVEGAATVAQRDSELQRVRQIVDATCQRPVPARWIVESGYLVARLAAAASARNAAFLVVGSDGPGVSLLTSVSADVARRACCPVIVVPPGSEGRGDDDHAGKLAATAGGGTQR